MGCSIRKSPDQRLLTAPRSAIVVRHVLHRLLVPRHPPCALTCLTKSLRESAFRSARFPCGKPKVAQPTLTSLFDFMNYFICLPSLTSSVEKKEIFKTRIYRFGIQFSRNNFWVDHFVWIKRRSRVKRKSFDLKRSSKRILKEFPLSKLNRK